MNANLNEMRIQNALTKKVFMEVQKSVLKPKI